jgi:methyl-accepting chemotaxis protein
MPEETFRWAITGGVAIATLCILTIAVVAILLYRVVIEIHLKTKAMVMRVDPVIDTIRQLTDDNAPKITVIATNAAEISTNARDISVVARDQARRFADVGRDIADRTKAQVARVDAVMDETVAQVHHAGDSVKAAVKKPVREATAVLAGVRAAVTTLVDGRRPTIDHITQDEEMFI